MASFWESFWPGQQADPEATKAPSGTDQHPEGRLGSDAIQAAEPTLPDQNDVVQHTLHDASEPAFAKTVGTKQQGVPGSIAQDEPEPPAPTSQDEKDPVRHHPPAPEEEHAEEGQTDAIAGTQDQPPAPEELDAEGRAHRIAGAQDQEDVAAQATPQEDILETQVKLLDEKVEHLEELKEQANARRQEWEELKEESRLIFEGVTPQLYEGEDLYSKVDVMDTKKPARGCWSWTWGGPITPREDDTLTTWTQTFFSTVWTGHGLNQAFHRESGPCRVIFWALVFAAAFAALVLGLLANFNQFFESSTSVVTYLRPDVDIMPMVTVCADTPFRCTCDAFYDPEATEQHFLSILPFICHSVIVFAYDKFPPIDDFLDFTNFSTIEQAASFVDIHLTKLNMINFKAQSCDNGNFTKEWLLGNLRNGTSVSYHEMLHYAGHHQRESVVRRCQTHEISGRTISCMSDHFWATPILDASRGVCHILNPCAGIPVGRFCRTDAHCQHADGPGMPGGFCVLRTETLGECVCNLCSLGEGCRILKQAEAGREAASTLVLNSGTQQSWMALRSDRAAVVARGASLFVHSAHARGLVEGSEIVAAGGKVTDVAVSVVAERASPYPHSNCSHAAFPDPALCTARCLRRVQAEQCCGLASPAQEGGRLASVNFTDSLGEQRQVADPTMACDVLNASVVRCLEHQAKQRAQGLICVEGSAGLESTHWWLLGREGWYDLRGDGDGDGVSDQEERSLAVRSHCVWAAGGAMQREPRHGTPCASHADCTPAVASAQGRCVRASRAYCPRSCSQSGVVAEVQWQQRVGKGTARVVAQDELNIVSRAVELLEDRARAANQTAPRQPHLFSPEWRKRCSADAGSEDCMTAEQAIALVSSSYAMVRLFQPRFEEELRVEQPLAPLPELLGAVGANLRLYVGMSAMSILELLEWLLLAVLAAPFFCCGARLPCVKQVDAATDDDHSSAEDGAAEVSSSWPAGKRGDMMMADRVHTIRRRPGRVPRVLAVTPVGESVPPHGDLVTATPEAEGGKEETGEQPRAAADDGGAERLAGGGGESAGEAASARGSVADVGREEVILGGALFHPPPSLREDGAASLRPTEADSADGEAAGVPRKPRGAAGAPEGFDMARFDQPLAAAGYDPNEPPPPQQPQSGARARKKRGLLQIAETPQQWAALKLWGKSMGPEAVDSLYMTRKRAIASPLYQSFGGASAASHLQGDPRIYHSADAVLVNPHPPTPPPQPQPSQSAAPRGSTAARRQTDSNLAALAPPSPLPRIKIPHHLVARYPPRPPPHPALPALLAAPAQPHRYLGLPPALAPPSAPVPAPFGPALAMQPAPPSRAPDSVGTQLRVPIPRWDLGPPLPPPRMHPSAHAAAGGGPALPLYDPLAPSTQLAVPLPQQQDPPARGRPSISRAAPWQAVPLGAAADASLRAAPAEEPLPLPAEADDAPEQLRKWLASFPALSA